MRTVQIFRMKDEKQPDKLLTVKECEKPRQALQDYFEGTLKPQGCYDPIFKGNVMSVKTKFHNYAMYKVVDV